MSNKDHNILQLCKISYTLTIRPFKMGNKTKYKTPHLILMRDVINSMIQTPKNLHHSRIN